MTIALIGAAGQLGTELPSSLSGDVALLTHGEIELTDASSVESKLAAIRPRLVINAAAYNLVDRAEEEPELAYAVNALGPRNLARFCAAGDVALLHVSTDFVFGLESPRDRPYSEDDVPGPLSAYATSKLAGEHFVRALCRRHYVVRTCGLYGPNPRHGNFVETMLRLAKDGRKLRVVDDQRCTPTSARDLAQAICRLVETEAYGLYHAANSGETTWYGFAAEIFRRRGVDADLAPITSAEYGAPARRPAYSVLDCSKLRKATGFEFQPWQNALADYLQRRDA